MKRLLPLCALAALALLSLKSAECAGCAREGLRLCLETVLPTLFPFFVASLLFVSCGAADGLGALLAPFMRSLFGVGGAGAAALALGLCGGYPVGAKTAAALYADGCLSRDEAERLLAFCNNAGPGFILGVCGGAVLESARAGAYLLLVHVAAALLTGVLLRRRGEAKSSRGGEVPRPARQSLARAFPAAVRDSFSAVWGVCGFVVFFMALRGLVPALPPRLAPLWGFLELTGGVLSLRGGGARAFVACAVLLGWGGLSVHAQTLSVLEGSGLSARYYLLGKAVHAALSGALAYPAALWLFP